MLVLSPIVVALLEIPAELVEIPVLAPVETVWIPAEFALMAKTTEFRFTVPPPLPAAGIAVALLTMAAVLLVILTVLPLIAVPLLVILTTLLLT